MVTTIKPNTWTVPSRSNPGTEHVVRLVNGAMTCTCEASFWGRECHHVKCVRIELQRAAITPTTEADAKRRDLGLYLLTGGKRGSAA